VTARRPWPKLSADEKRKLEDDIARQRREAEEQTAKCLAAARSVYTSAPPMLQKHLHNSAIFLALDLCNNAQVAEADGVLMLLPETIRAAFFDWYFDETAPNELPGTLLYDSKED